MFKMAASIRRNVIVGTSSQISRTFCQKLYIMFWKHNEMLLHKLSYQNKQFYSNIHHIYRKCKIIENSRKPVNLCNLCKVHPRFLYIESLKCRKKVEKYVPSRSKKQKVIDIWKNMTISQLAKQMERNIGDVYEAMSFVNDCEDYLDDNQELDDLNTISRISKTLGFRCKVIRDPTINIIDEKPFNDAVRRPPPDPSSVVKRPPVITIMGHVDHGKTTLLDTLRHTAVVEQEFGGITQHIGAFIVKLANKEQITFLDTPGHAAFSAMRARGANVTDIVVLVVAADDGVMPQTVESIRYAKEADVPIIVAINKIDKPNCDIEAIKTQLLIHGIQLEDLGGDVQAVAISALKGMNLDQLLDAILLQAELMEIRCDPAGLVEGVVLESSVKPGRGKLCTVLIHRGTLKKADVVVAGVAWGKVRAMFDEWNKPVEKALPGTPVQIIGWKELPSAGDEMLGVETEKRAREIVNWREQKKMTEKQTVDAVAIREKIEQHQKKYKAELQERREKGLKFKLPTPFREKEYQETYTGPKLSIIIKGDVHGSVEAILDMLATYQHQNLCCLDIMSYGVGDITESDIELAELFDGIIYGFNVKVPNLIATLKTEKKVILKEYNIIYELFYDIKEEINKRLPLLQKEEIIGEASVLQEFMVTAVGKKKVPVAGCQCTSGMLKKDALFRISRDSDLLYEGKLASLYHLKNEVNTIHKGTECGLRVEDPSIRFQLGDSLVCYEMVDVEQKIDWNPGF